VTNSPEYDVIIIGAGPAGLTAGIYALRSGLSTLILESKYPGGRIIEAHKVENYPGFPEALSGYELIQRMLSQLERFGGEITANAEVLALSLATDIKSITTRQHQYTSKAVIIAFGVKRKKLFIPGEQEYLGKGVSYCATCDGPFFKGKKVAVIGSGYEAVEEALYLTNLASQVYLIPNAKTWTAPAALLTRLEKEPNAQIYPDYQIQAITGNSSVQSITLTPFTDDTQQTLPISGVFVAVGVVPTTAILKQAGITVSPQSWITVDRTQQTNLEGVFAAGDCTGWGFQVATAVGEGAMAALSTSRFLKKRAK
jgi:thioredoxin reductase (NADPH)